MTSADGSTKDDATASTRLDGLVDLASERLGGHVTAANDEFFAPKENLVRSTEAVFEPDRYTERGKWMDGWETRRRRVPGNDWCVVALGAPGRLRRAVVDTSHFRGNHPEACSLDGWVGEANPDGSASEGWKEVLPRSPLAGHSRNEFAIAADGTFEHVRLNIFPDGGVARLRLYGEPRPDWPALRASAPVDLASALHGGAPLACSDRFFSDPRNLLLPDPSTHMGDGWETRRRRGPGHDWVVIRLGHAGWIDEVEVDTRHFKGNYPAACSLEASSGHPGSERTAVGAAGGGFGGGETDWDACEWREILPRTELGPDGAHRFALEARRGSEGPPPVSLVRFNIFPDGGVARLRLRGRPHP